MSLLYTFVAIILKRIFSPDSTRLTRLGSNIPIDNDDKLFSLIRGVSPRRRRVLLRTSTTSAFSKLVNGTVLTKNMVLVVRLISTNREIDTLQTVNTDTPVLPGLFVLVFLAALLMRVNVVLIIIPKVVVTVLLTLTPIVLMRSGVNVFTSVHDDVQLA